VPAVRRLAARALRQRSGRASEPGGHRRRGALRPLPAGAVLAFLDELADAAGTDRLDLLVLNTAGPVAREQALVFGTPLFLSSPDMFAEAQIAASLERLDTDVLRRQELEMLRTS
jgi:hypothetical protein